MIGRNKIIVVTAATVLMACQGTIVRAQEEQGVAAPPKQAQETGVPGGNSPYHLRRVGEMHQRPEAHKNRIAQIVDDEKKQLNVLREDRTLSKEQKKEKALAIREATHARIRALLSPEEQKKYDAAREKDRQFREAMSKRKGAEAHQ